MGASRGEIGCSVSGKRPPHCSPRRMFTFTNPPDTVGAVDTRLAACFNWGKRNEAVPSEVGKGDVC
jgi:hypothetical protein